MYPNFSKDVAVELTFQLPDPEDDKLSESDFLNQVDSAWQVCDRFDLQTDIWRGRILRTVRDREKHRGGERGIGFLNWLKEREISKTQAYSLIELANSADTLLEGGVLEPEDVNHFSKRAFIETAQAVPEVQQMVGDRVREAEGDPRVTQREVKRLAEEWTAMTSELLPVEIREKAANNTIPARYLTPLVRELEKLPDAHQTFLRQEVAESPDVDTVKQVTAEAHYLAKYLAAAVQVQALNTEALDVEMALEEALRIGCLNSTAELVNQAAQLEQTVAKLYTTWKRVNSLAERVYLDSGASTPQLRSLLAHLNPLTQATLQVTIGEADLARTIQLSIATDEA
ncbi:hypothetical protein IFO70_11130 [Phormidium tenue FACHB-886]|nr:hypothetical protein [Phormidium tenue FACHB-886]